MTEQERQQLKILFVITASYYSQQIPDEALRMYVDDLEDLPFESVVRALKDLRRDPKTIRCPLPAHVRARIHPELDPEIEANLVANEIVQAIGHVGPYSLPMLGETARRVVAMEGGWQQVCEMVTYENMTTHKAQWRNLARSLIVRRKMGSDPTLLPDPDDPAPPNNLLTFRDILKDMPK